KAAWTPPYGPAYISWHSDFNDERARTEIIPQELQDPRMRVRPNPDEVTRAAKLLVEARMPLMVVGDEIYKAKAATKAVKLAEVPLVCDVGYGLDDLIAAIEQLMTPALKQKAAERAVEVRKFSEWARGARAQLANSPDWDQSPIIADRLTWEVAKFADPDAII